MKVACVTTSREEMDRFGSFLAKGYAIEKSEDRDIQEGQYTNVYTLKENPDPIPDPIRDMFSLLETITGINPDTPIRKKETFQVRKATCYLLYYRFGLSHQKVAQLLGYKTHRSSLIVCREMGQIEVNNVSIEMAIRRTLDSLK